MSETLRWAAFAVGVVIVLGTITSAMKILIVPRRSWSLLGNAVAAPITRLFNFVARRCRSFDLADRFLGFLGPTLVIGVLVALLASFTVGYALLLLPWTDIQLAGALRESGSSVFTLGFVLSEEPISTVINVLAGATGMTFVALTVGYLPALYATVKRREALVKKLEPRGGCPPWGPEILIRHHLAQADDEIDALFAEWDTWAAHVADTHMKYPVLARFRLPRSQNHWLISLLAVADAAALRISLQPSKPQGKARLYLEMVATCLENLAHVMPLSAPHDAAAALTQYDYRAAADRMTAAGVSLEMTAEQTWLDFAAIRARYVGLAAPMIDGLFLPAHRWSIGSGREGPGPTGTTGRD
ncbi:MAG: hypothetical protein GY722_21275 [bacterium]|nr:hypothetical protein [bacterium]